jgi:hypothetical protein
MMPRRLALALVVATTAAAGCFGASAARASSTICVALVVDGRSLGSDVSTTCAKVHEGATGVDVLQAGGHKVGFRSDGLLCTVDGLPKSGCQGVDDTHYWAYFHRAPGSTKWVYSSEGSSTYQPVDDSTEGWVYDNGTALRPDDVPYAAICKQKVSPTRSAAPTRSASPEPTQPTQPAHTATPAPNRRSSPATTATHHRNRRKPAGTPALSATSTLSASTLSASTPSASATSAALTGAVGPPSNHHGLRDLLLGLLVIAVLGVSAAIRFRRARP